MIVPKLRALRASYLGPGKGSWGGRLFATSAYRFADLVMKPNTGSAKFQRQTLHRKGYAAEHAPHGCRVFGGVSVVIVIEVDPGFLGAARFNPVRPRRQFAL